MRYNIPVLLFIFLSAALMAQPGKEAWHWAFGDSCSLDFSSGSIVAGSSPMKIVEGSAIYSDPLTGQLLFFTDGTTVWDKNSNLMPNGWGLYGGYGTSSQAALIIPKPGSSTLFYIVTADQGGYRPQPVHGINYSVLDLTLNSGLGDITIKNHSLTPPPTTEKLVGIRHCNGSDYWVITHSFLSDAFNAYKVTSSGIDTIPVISHVGTIHNDGGPSTDSLGTIGCMKASPNGNKLAVAVEYYVPMIELFDFNSSTGMISNPIKIDFSGLGWSGGSYGVAFSPDNKKLYASNETYCLGNSPCKSVILQYDISNYSLPPILASKAIVDSMHDSGAMQLGPDGKIYVSVYNSNYLNVINNPNGLGAACGFQVNAVPLAAGTKSKLGLPNFIDTKDSVSPITLHNILSLCSFPSYGLSADSGQQYHWNNGDTTITSNINDFGTYWVSFMTPAGCSETDSFMVIQKFPPLINVLHDTSVCSNSPSFPISVNASYPGTLAYNWSDGFTAPVHTVSPGMYSVQYTLPDFCTTRDSFVYLINSLPAVNAGRDTNLCEMPYAITLTAVTSASNYEWNTGENQLQIFVSDSGNHWINVYDVNGCTNSDTVHVGFLTPPVINVLRDTFQCSNALNSYTVDATYAGAISYLWNDNLTSPIRTIMAPGYYQVEYHMVDGCIAYDGFLDSEILKPQPNLGNDTAFCEGKKDLDAGYFGATYLWNTGETTQQIEVHLPAQYWVIVTQYGCSGSDTLKINPDLSNLKFIMPNIVTPNGDGINDGIDFSKFKISELHLKILNRWGNSVFESSDPNTVWNTSEDDGTYYYIVTYKMYCGAESKSNTLKGFITIIR